MEEQQGGNGGLSGDEDSGKEDDLPAPPEQLPLLPKSTKEQRVRFLNVDEKDVRFYHLPKTVSVATPIFAFLMNCRWTYLLFVIFAVVIKCSTHCVVFLPLEQVIKKDDPNQVAKAYSKHWHLSTEGNRCLEEGNLHVQYNIPERICSV